jgi:SprT protein
MSERRIIETPEQYHALLKECVTLTHEWIGKCNETFGIRIPSKLPVRFNLKGTTAGRAYLSEGTIGYNPTLLRENPDAFLRRTVGHEVAHFAAFLKFGGAIDPHGAEWRSMMWKLGLDATRCHSYDTQHVPSRLGSVPNKKVAPTIINGVGKVKPVTHGKIIEFD